MGGFAVWGRTRGLGILAIAVVGAALPSGAQAPQVQTAAAVTAAEQPAAPVPVVDYWTGDLNVTGQFRKDPSLALNGSTLNFSLGGAAEPINGSVRIKVWTPEDGVVRLQINDCVTALRPAVAGGDLTTGGAFTPDFAFTNTPVNCGLQQGEVIVKRSDVLTPTAEGIRYAYSSENKLANPKGTGKMSGEGLLRPVFKPIPKPPRPPMAMTGAVPGTPVPTGQFSLAEGVKYYGIERALDAVLQLDSRAWLINRYDVGSVTNGKFLSKSKDGKGDLLYGEYELNGGRRGWLKVQLEGGDAKCIEYFDAFGVCKAPGAMSVGGRIAMGAMISALTDTGGGSSSSSSYDGCEGGACDPQRSSSPSYASSPPPINSFYGSCHNPTGC